MLFIILDVAILAVAIYFGCRYKEIVIFGAGTIVALLFSIPLFANPPTVEPYGIYTVEIVQLRQGKEASIDGGGWFLGWSISSNEEMQYVVMHKENGKMIRKFLDQKMTYIVETDESPRVEYKEERWTWPKWRTWPTQWDRVDEMYDKRWATIYVPHGTVAFQFESI